ncbi:putative selenium-dependent hydroxylase accessory protein YqeC [Photobacterium makurazakiensis]|uniref:selenium cofactor biosynthesis protein YqeC n=1 Tax=Photobacterium makurazakiensis TaxID=2910234 RepID=UPI003D10689F
MNNRYGSQPQLLSLFPMLDISRLHALQVSPLVISLVGAGGKTTTAYWLADLFKRWGHRVCVTTTTKMYLPESNHVDYIVQYDYLNDINRHFYAPINDKEHHQYLPDNDFYFSEPSITFCYQSLIKSRNDKNKIKVSGLTINEIEILKNTGHFTVFIIESDGARSLPIKAPFGHEPCIPNCTDMVIGLTGAEAINKQADPDAIHRWSAFSSITQCQQGDEVNHNILNKLIAHPNGMFKNTPEHAIKIWLINKVDLHHDLHQLCATAEVVMMQNKLLDAIWLTEMMSVTPIKKILVKEQFALAT